MTAIQYYSSPLGMLLLAADEEGLTGVWFEGQKHFARTLPAEHTQAETPVLADTKRWLDVYFSGRAPDFLPGGVVLCRQAPLRRGQPPQTYRRGTYY